MTQGALWTPSGAEQEAAPARVSILTVLQPIAAAMTTPDYGFPQFGDDGGFVPRKPIENRRWRPRKVPAGGLLVAVRAGAKWWNPIGKPTAQPSAEGLAWVRERWPEMPDPDDLPTSAVVGVVRVRLAARLHRFVDGGIAAVEPLPGDGPTECVWLNQVERSPWVLGPIAWVVDRAWALPEPFPWRPGGLSLEVAPPEIAALCLATGATLAAGAR